MNIAMIDKWKKAIVKVICADIGKTGSGFFIDDQGFFITNNHVIHKMSIDRTGAIRLDYSKEIFVEVSGNTYRASLVIDVNSDHPVVFDYAILRLDMMPADYLEVADILKIYQGEEVMALGYPMNFNVPIITTGIISAIIARPSHINTLHRIKTFLTNTLVTYGNSGGPLIRISDGKVIGINTMHHEIRDEVKERLIKYRSQPGIEIIPPVCDLIEFVLKYTTIGFNYAISVEYAMNDPTFKSHKEGG